MTFPKEGFLVPADVKPGVKPDELKSISGGRHLTKF